MKKKIAVMIVDDSALMRRTMCEVLNDADDIEVIATAQDPYVAAQKMRKQAPDVMILDIEMPRMDGITFLKKIMSQNPLPVIICSSYVGEGSNTAFTALQCGAVEVIAKPDMGTQEHFVESSIQVIDAVRAAARAKLGTKKGQASLIEKKNCANVIIEAPTKHTRHQKTDRIIVVGVSTGGADAVERLLQPLDVGMPGIVITQHMPAGFTASFAERLNDHCRLLVREAQGGEMVEPGTVFIAPGGHHLLLKRRGKQYSVELRDGPLVSRHRPSVDVLFRSAARYAGTNAIGVILTGMGDDGAAGMKEMHDAGARTIAQDEASCVVFGMPKAAIERGGVDEVLPLDKIPLQLSAFSREKNKKRHA